VVPYTIIAPQPQKCVNIPKLGIRKVREKTPANRSMEI